MNNDLLRQRRNLLITTVGLLLFEFAKVSVAKVSILGTELLVGDARALLIFAWVMWAYFLLRYHQYLKQEGNLGIEEGVTAYFKAKATRYLFRKDGRKAIMGEFRYQQKGIRWAYSLREHDSKKPGQMNETKSGYLPLPGTWWWKLTAYLHMAMHTPKVTDHVLPFALASATAITGLVRLCSENNP